MFHRFWFAIKFFLRRGVTAQRVAVVAWFFLVASLPYLAAVWSEQKALTIEPPAQEQAVYVLPEAGIKPVIDFFDDANETLDVNIYLLTHSEIFNALKRAKERGVKVRVIFEHNPFGGGFLTGKTRERLQELGIEFRDGPKKFSFDHAKYIVRDNSAALISTANFTQAAFDKNREIIVIDQDQSDVILLTRLFAADWESEPFRDEDPEVVISPQNSRRKLEGLITNASKELLAAVEVFDDPDLEKAFIEAARRGVAVKVLLADPKEISSNQTTKEHLEAGGVEVKILYKPFLHAKYLVADSRAAYVGSVNFTTNSLTANREVGLLTVASEAVRVLREWFFIDWGKADKSEKGAFFGPRLRDILLAWNGA